jgi:hypothetical protein
MKQLPVKNKVPKEVSRRLAHIQTPPFWSQSSEGWSPYRLDVIAESVVQLCFNACVIFLFMARIVLDKCDLGIFPLLFIGMIVLAAIYKCNVKIQMYDRLLITRKQLLKHYLKYQLVFDIILIVMCILEYLKVEIGIFRLAVLFRFYQCVFIVKRIKTYLHVLRFAKFLWEIITIYLLNIFIAHCVAIIFIAMTRDEQHSWMTPLGLSANQTQWVYVYIKAFYWSMTTLLCASFGDIVPATYRETVIVTLIEMIGLSLLAF